MKNRHFSSRQAAEAYARGRPYVHKDLVDSVRRSLGIEQTVGLALDVACGTGLSAIALKEMADRIIALDVSFNMLSLAPRDEQIDYVHAAAEHLPLAGGRFDFVSVSSALHWFDKKVFAEELARVLRPGGLAAIYQIYFTGELKGVSEFGEWFRNAFRTRYPTPPRDHSFMPADFESQGLILLGEELFDRTICFTTDGFTLHLLSMTNVTSAVQRGQEDFAAAAEWVRQELDQFGPLQDRSVVPQEHEFLFAGSIRYLRKQTS